MPFARADFDALIGDRLLTCGALDCEQVAVTSFAECRLLMLEEFAVWKRVLATGAHKAFIVIL